MPLPQLSPLGLGTAPLGGLYSPVSDDDAHRVIEAAWAHGVRFFDTAPMYGNGSAERRLGAALQGKPRDSYVLATKVGRLLRLPSAPKGEDAYYKGTPPERPVFDFSYDGVMRSFEESLARLGLDRIDILHIHDPDAHEAEAMAGAYRALDRLRAEGAIKAVGAGMNQWEMLARFAEAGAFDCFLLAGRYTLIDQSALATLLPICERRGVRIIAGGVYNSGLLADPKPGAKFNYDDAPPEMIARAHRLATVCRSHGVQLKAAAIQFPAFHPAVKSILTGARSVAELNENVAMTEAAISAELWDELKSEGLIAKDAPTSARAPA
ncbi:MAG: aldo/keto reductase [Hyphomicrobiales bacterium]|jgi:D-threo-aldose 1-dehydrogenase|nr:aldo/keto reductase [Methylobacterium sp.]MCA3647236.1 aldo/keto reductase [Methylobacterium sp.]MCA4923310.1 aldo/keto reductase [Methylobacterium sp.]MCE2931840.1 aldo/keto reductase [Hyphomicrobiales bacterium]MCZ8271603.1 aldo/keto reductase [Beijerinckiaceae bacterium]